VQENIIDLNEVLQEDLFAINTLEFIENDNSIQRYHANISDLNGTWISDWYLRRGLNLQEMEREYSWGMAKGIYDTTFDIDITSDSPFILAPGPGIFMIKNITQINNNTMLMHVERQGADNFLEVFFSFIDKDKLWILVQY